MLDTTSETASDRRPAIVICRWDALESAGDLVEDLSGQPWSPPGARTIAVNAETPAALIETLGGLLGDPRTRGVLIVGRTRKPGGFRLQLRAENRVVNGSERLSEVGPGVARATAPVAEIIRALGEAGLTAEATSEAEDDEGSHVLYEVLANLADDSLTPSIGLLRAPEDEAESVVTAAVKVVAETMARNLSPLPRSYG